MRRMLSKNRHVLTAFALLLSLSIYELHKALFACTRLSVGLFGDAYSTIWSNWVETQQGSPIWQGTTHYVSAAKGEAFWTFDWWTSFLIRGPEFILSKFFGSICGYNIMVTIGVLTSAMLTWGLVFWLTKSQPAAILAAITIGFGPFVGQALTGHINYVFIGVFALLIYLILRMQERNRKGLIVSGIILGMYSYLDGYYIIPVLGSLFLYLFFQVSINIRVKVKLDKLVKQSFYLFSSYFMTQLPLIIIYIFNKKSKLTLPQRDWNELNVYAIRPWYLLLPGASNMYLGSGLKNWESLHLGGSNFSETGLFAGYLFIIFALIVFFQNLSLLKVSFFKKTSTQNRIIDSHISGLILFTLLGIWLSMRPWVHFGPIRIPFPSGLLFHIAPYWRTISRWGMITTISIVCLGSIGLTNYLASKRRLHKNIFLFFSFAMVSVCLGIPNSLNPATEAVIKDNSPYSWIQKNTAADSILLDVTPYSIDGFFVDFALTSKRKIANALRLPSTSSAYDILHPGRANFVCEANRAKADYILIHSSMYKGAKSENILGLTEVKRFHSQITGPYSPWFDATLFKPNKSISGNYAINYSSNFVLSGNNDWKGSWQLKKSTGNISIYRASRSSNAPLAVELKSLSDAQPVTLLLNQKKIWEGNVGTSLIGIKIPAFSGSTKYLTVVLGGPATNEKTISGGLIVEFSGNCPK